MSVLDLLHSASRNWYLLLACALVAAGATLLLAVLEDPRYRSGVRLAVGPAPALEPETRARLVDSLNDRVLITTFAEIAGARTIFRDAAAEVGLPTGELSRYSVSSVALPEANVVALDVDGPRRTSVEELASKLAARSIGYIEGFYRDVSLRDLDGPARRAERVAPRPELDVPLAAAGGLAVGFLLGLFRDHLRARRGRRDRAGP